MCIDVPGSQKHPSIHKAQVLEKISAHPYFWTMFRTGKFSLAFGYLYRLIRDKIGGTNSVHVDITNKLTKMIDDYTTELGSLSSGVRAVDRAESHLEDIKDKLEQQRVSSDSVSKAVKEVETILGRARLSLADM